MDLARATKPSVHGVPDPVFLSGDDVPDYFRGVELATAGMEWPASTGPCTLTLEHLADAVRAANDDPHIQPPRIKLGHTSSVNGDHPDHDPFAAIGDAEPAFGRFTNLRLANDGAVLLGDADYVPQWLAEMAPSAYPNRSAEGTWQVAEASFDVQTAGGKRYSFVCTAVSLLGVFIPAVADLEDLSLLITSGPAALAAHKEATVSEPAALSVSTSVIRERFNFDWAMDSDNGVEQNTYWWWARDVRVDDDEVIADDDEGGLWSVPYSTDGEDTVTFGEPTRVRETFVPVAAKQVASFSRPSKPSRKPAASAANTSAATARPNEGDTAMPVTDQVREFLVGRGIDPDTASEVQINAATVLMAEQPPAATTEVDEAETDETPEAEVETPEVERVPVAASVDATFQATKDQAMADMSARLEAMTQRENARLAAETKDRRDRKVSAAVGKQITPAEREHYRGLMDIDEDRTDALLSALPANRCPLDARAEIPDPTADPALSADELPANVSLLNPTERAALKARRAV